MPELLANVVFVLLAVIGAVDLIRWSANRLLKSEQSDSVILVVPIQGHDERAEVMLNAAIEKLQWMSERKKRIICVDYGMDEETNKVCRIISKRNPILEICTPEELSKILEQ